MKNRKVPERPSLPQGVNENPRSLVTWARSAISALGGVFQQYGFAINSLIDSIVRLNWLDVRDFGAVGNGIADDTKAFKAAIAAAGEHDTIYAPVGIYRITDTLVIDGTWYLNIDIRGEIKYEGASRTAAFQFGDIGTGLNGATPQDEVRYCRVFVKNLVGTGKANGQWGVRWKNGFFNRFEVERAVDFDVFSYNFPDPDQVSGENFVRFGDVRRCTFFATFESDPALLQVNGFAEGMQYEGGAVFENDNGIVVPDTPLLTGGIYFEGVIDNAAIPGASDYINNNGPNQLGNYIASKFLRRTGNAGVAPGLMEPGPRDIVVNPNMGELFVRRLWILPDAGLFRPPLVNLGGADLQDGGIVFSEFFSFTGTGFNALSKSDTDRVVVGGGANITGIDLSRPTNVGGVLGMQGNNINGIGIADADFFNVEGNNALSWDAANSRVVVGGGTNVSQIDLNKDVTMLGKNILNVNEINANFFNVEGNNALSWQAANSRVVVGGGTNVSQIDLQKEVVLGGKKIINLGDPTANQDAATKSYVDTTVSNATEGGGFASGTRMVFHQASAPTGWTTDTTAAVDRVLMVDHTEAGTGSSVGGWTISGLSNGSTGNTFLSKSQMPSHNHGVTAPNGGSFLTAFSTSGNQVDGYTTGSIFANVSANGSPPETLTSGSAGSGNSHSHSGSTISHNGNWRPQRHFVQIAVKD